jgi:asparagine synthase (glutamine-hydrolysing)
MGFLFGILVILEVLAYMCGLTAIIPRNNLPAEAVISQMTNALTHRGPDAQGFLLLPGCHLGHARLAILDPAGGLQPMIDESGRYCIVFNGEIYNYEDLRVRLVEQGYSFRTRSDTEVVLQSYKRWEEGVCTLLNGPFAFVIWDIKEQRLFAARDRFGEKPMYYSFTADGTLLIASEIKGLLASGLVRPRLNLPAVDAYLALLYIPPNQSVYENVHTLLPGCAMTYQEGRLKSWSYWQPRFSETPISVEEAIEELSEKLRRAVYRQMVTADVPVGALLSGGIDSSTVVALMQQQSDRPIKTFSVGFGRVINELPYARATAQKYGTEHYELQVDIDVAESLQAMATVYDEPFADSSNIPTYLIAKFAREHVRVVLSGDGADELFNGYDTYVALLGSETASRSFFYMNTLRLTHYVRRLLRLPDASSLMRRIMSAKLARLKQPDMWRRHLTQITYLSPAERRLLWGERAHRAMAPAQLDPFYPDESVQGVSRASYFDIRCYLAGDILVKVDRATMAHGLESRAPFLDVELADFALSLPYRLKFCERGGKAILRQSCAQLLPAEIISRPKQGFGGPVTVWLQNPEVRTLLSRVLAPSSPLSYIFPTAARQQLRGYTSWILLNLGLWLERHPDCLHDL